MAAAAAAAGVTVTAVAGGLFVNGATEILKKLAHMVSQEIKMASCMKDDLKKVAETLETIMDVMADAERRQVNEKTVRHWLERLKDVAYEADDVLDEFSYEAMHRADDKNGSNKVHYHLFSSSNPLAFHVKMAHKIKAINKHLDQITNDMVKLNFANITTIASTSTTSQNRVEMNRQTSSYVDVSEIVGRDNDKSDIISMLLTTNIITSSSSSSSSLALSSAKYSSPYAHDDEKISIISIVGMGGLGKTTLAQLVYNDELVSKHFELKLWVFISDDFSVFKILKSIMESITKQKSVYAANLDVLVSLVREKLIGKKYLLVLDDLWNADAEQWDKFKNMLDVGAQGSKILVTTRLDQVAHIVGGAIPPYSLKQLSEDKCWSIISRKAFFSDGASETQNMILIGKEISKKCIGLPLAATFLGSLMHLKKRESDWESIRDQNDIWDNSENQGSIIPILKLSYDNLPSHLKQCFSYCAIFPKHWDIDRKTLIQLWMAEGFLPPSDDDENGLRSIEDVGNQYFESLLWCSFFQDVKKDHLGGIVTCKMHDLVHDLAQKVVGENECSTVKVKSEMYHVSKARRLLLDFDDEISGAFTKALHHADKLRTIFDVQPRGHLDLNNNKYLRVLHFHHLLPSSIPKLRHLRYLHLRSYGNDSLGTIQQSNISSLYNLQTLVLHGAQNVQNFPSYIVSLKNLRHLDFCGSNIEILPDSISNLCNLRHLDVSYTGILVLPASIYTLRNLRYLDLSGTDIAALPDSVTSLCNLRTLGFSYCRKLKELPRHFGRLIHLRSLDLRGTNIQVLPESCSNNLTNLEIVQLGLHCKLPKEIQNWTNVRHLIHKKSDGMPRGIEHLTLLQILDPYVVRKKENEVTENIVRSSTSIGGIGELHDLYLLEELTVLHLENVKSPIEAESANLNGKLNLRELTLRWNSKEDDQYNSDCDDVVVLEALQPHPNLKELCIDDFTGWKLPKWVGGVSSSSSCLLINLVKMVLSNCRKCKQLPALGQLPNLRYLYIWKMDSVKSLGKEFYYDDGQSGEDMGRSSSIFFPLLSLLKLKDMESLEEWVVPPFPSTRPTIVLPSKIPAAYSSFPVLERIFITNCPKLRTTPTSFPSLIELKLDNSNGVALNSIARGVPPVTFIPRSFESIWSPHV